MHYAIFDYYTIISAKFVVERNMLCSDAESSSTVAEISVSTENLSSVATTWTYSTTTRGGTTFSIEPTSDGANVFENILIC